MRIPIGIINDDCVRGLQIETETAGTGRQKETKYVRAGSIVLSEQLGTLVRFRRTVKSEVGDPTESEKVLHDVHDLRHLEEHQDTMTGGAELGQDAVEQLEFARCTPEQIVVLFARIHLIFHLLEDERMVAQFAQLHEHIAQTPNTSLTTLAIADVDAVERHQLLIDLGLQSRETAFYDSLLFVGEILLNILFQTTQQEWSKNLMKTTDDEQLFFFGSALKVFSRILTTVLTSVLIMVPVIILFNLSSPVARLLTMLFAGFSFLTLVSVFTTARTVEIKIDRASSDDFALLFYLLLAGSRCPLMSLLSFSLISGKL